MKISAVVPVYNGEKFIAECIESLLKQERKFDEIIVLDDGSSDRTVDIVKKYGVVLIQILHSGRSKARNTGLEKAKSEIVFFVEADAIYSKNFLSECIKLFSDDSVGGVIGKLEVKNKDASPWTRCRAAELNSRFSEYKPFTAWMYRKPIIRKIGGFDESLDIGEDVLLGERVRKAGFKIAYAPNAVWHHFEPESITKVWGNSWKRGVEMIKKYKKSNFPATILIDFFVLVFLLMGLWKGLFFIVPLLYAVSQLYVRRKQFLFIEKKYIFHLGFFILSGILFFKLGRFLGLLKYGWELESTKSV